VPHLDLNWRIPAFTERRMSVTLLLFALCLLVAVPATADSGTPQATLDTSQIVVTFEPAVSTAAVADTLADANATPVTQIPQININAVSVPADQAATALTSLRADPDVASARLDTLDHMTGTPLTTNDPLANGSGWQFSNTRINEAWRTTTGSATVVIAVVDTGVNANHEDLAGKVLPGYDFVNGDSDPSDDEGHGTGVAGIIAAIANNGRGITGVCPSCMILPVKVLDSDGYGWDSTIAAGVTYATDHGARVINLSLGSASPNPATQAAVAYAEAHGVLVVMAAGNDDVNAPHYPASYADSGSLSVIATRSDDNRYSVAGGDGWGSNYGHFDVAAPGCVSAPTWWGNYQPPTNHDYAYSDSFCGTSIATPFTAGVAGLAFSYKPTATNVQVASAIEQTALALPVPGQAIYGRIDAPNALAWLGGPVDPYDAPVNLVAPTISNVSPVGGATLSLTPGSWSGSKPLRASYTVRRCDAAGASCVSVGTFSGPGYTIANADRGSRLTYIATMTNAGGSASVAATNMTNVIPPPPVYSGTLSLSGTLQEGQTITASATASDFSGVAPITLAFAWRSVGGSWTSTGASPAYTLPSSTVGLEVQVQVTATDGSGGQTSVTSALFGPVIAAPPAVTASPSLSGSAQVGQTLTTDGGRWIGSPALTYQWWACDANGAACLPVANATGAHYTLTTFELGLRLKVTVTGTSGLGSASGDSPLSALVGAAPVVPPAAPSGGGGGSSQIPPQLALTVSASTTRIQPGGQVGYRIAVSSKNAGSATGMHLLVTLPTGATLADSKVTRGSGCAQRAQTVDCNLDWLSPPLVAEVYIVASFPTAGAFTIPFATTERETDVDPSDNQVSTSLTVGDATISKTAVGVAAAPTLIARPSLSGTFMVGEQLTVSRGLWQGARITYRFGWNRCDAAGSHCVKLTASGNTYRLQAADRGKRIKLTVTATNAAGSQRADWQTPVIVAPAKHG
jgi:thermitase